MVQLKEEDKKHIESTTGTFAVRGVIDHLKVIEKEHGKEMVDKIEKEMKDLGYGLDFSKLKMMDEVPTSFYIAFNVVEKELLELDEEGMRDMGRKAAKLSFLLRFASQLLVSIRTLCDNADKAWKKYYKNSGEVHLLEMNEKEGKIVFEVRDFVGHPVHCRFLEGYFGQIVSFVTGKEVDCKEESCHFQEGDKTHRFILTW